MENHGDHYDPRPQKKSSGCDIEETSIKVVIAKQGLAHLIPFQILLVNTVLL